MSTLGTYLKSLTKSGRLEKGGWFSSFVVDNLREAQSDKCYKIGLSKVFSIGMDKIMHVLS